MIKSRLVRGLLCATVLGGTVASPAPAQRIDRIVAFGDSYADDGNLFQLARIDPRTTFVYTTGRFSGGTNYVDTLGELLRVPIDNFAIGGARTNSGNETFGLPGFLTEVAIFRSGGGGVFPSVSGTFDAKDLVTISIGGNDSRAFQKGGGTLAGAPADAARAVGLASNGIQTLVSAGARTISFLAGDTSRLPEVNFERDPAGAIAVRTAYSSAFNTGIQQALAGQAANGVIVHCLDLNAILNRVTANFGAYGLTGLACPAFPPPVGPGRPGSLACVDQNVANRFLFYGDQLHLTSAGFAIVGRYVAAQLTAPLTFQGPSELALNTAHHFSGGLARLADLAPPRDGEAATGLRMFLFGDYFQHDIRRSDATDAFATHGLGGTAGVELGFGRGVVGLAGNYMRPRARFENDALRVKGRTFQLGAYGVYAADAAFAQANFAYGRNEYRITRTGVIDNLDAEPDGNQLSAGLKLGYLLSLGSLRAGPVGSIQYARAEIDSYTEKGDAALALSVGDVDAESLRGNLGLEVRGQVGTGDSEIRPFVMAGIEKELSGDGHMTTFAQTSAPTIVNRFDVGRRSEELYGRISAGASARLAGAARLEATVNSTLGKDDSDEFSGQLGVSIDF